MHWLSLDHLEQLSSLKNQSFTKPVVIFKHSTRCSISSMAKSRLECEPNWNEADFYYLDLLQHRAISNHIAEEFDVHHESPQLILLHHGACVFDQSHNGITVEELKEQLQQLVSDPA